MASASTPSEPVKAALGAPPPTISIHENGSPSKHSFQQTQQPSAAGGGLMSSLKGGAGSLMKNIRDKSHSVIQTVQHSMAIKG